MTEPQTITLTRKKYHALLARQEELEERLAALDADDGNRIPHEVALAIMRGESPFAAFRHHLGITLRDLSKQTGIVASYLSEIERGIKSGSTAALSRIATVFGTTIDTLLTTQSHTAKSKN